MTCSMRGFVANDLEESVAAPGAGSGATGTVNILLIPDGLIVAVTIIFATMPPGNWPPGEGSL